MNTQLANLVLRGVTLFSRFVLVLLLAHYLGPAALGTYGLLTASITYCVLLVGLDFYTYSQRELMAVSAKDRYQIVGNHAFLCVGTYIIGVPIFLLIFIYELLPWWLAPWFYGLLVLDHFSQELTRVLIAVRRPLAAGLTLFLRHGLWVWPVLIFMSVNPGSRNLTYVLGFWVTGCLVAVVFGGCCAAGEIQRYGKLRLDLRWIAKGLKIALIFLLAALCLRGILTFDRYIVEALQDLPRLGAYTLYAGLVASIVSVLDATVFVFRYPALVSAFRRGETVEYNRQWSLLVTHTSAAIALLAIAYSTLGPLAFRLLDNPIYQENLNIYWILLAGFVFYGCSMVPHYGLYALGRDRSILAGQVCALLTFFVMVGVLFDPWPTNAVPLSVAVAFAVMLVLKTWAYLKYRPVAGKMKLEGWQLNGGPK